MTKLKRTLKEIIKNRFNRESHVDRYLSGASSLEEIERRQRELTRQGF